MERDRTWATNCALTLNPHKDHAATEGWPPVGSSVRVLDLSVLFSSPDCGFKPFACYYRQIGRRYSVNWRLLRWIGVILILAGCQADKTVPPEVIPSSTLRPGVKADDLYVNEETERRMAELMASKPGGIRVGIHGTYEEMVPDSYTTFRLKQGQPFLGEFLLHSAKHFPLHARPRADSLQPQWGIVSVHGRSQWRRRRGKNPHPDSHRW